VLATADIRRRTHRRGDSSLRQRVDRSFGTNRGALGARVTHEPIPEYGNAYFTGFKNARGKYLVTGDADDIYDFPLIPQFLAPLEGDGCDFVTGSHSLGGGHGQSKGLHRSFGNPALTRILRAPSDFCSPVLVQSSSTALGIG
jgi:hypothetical protein